MIQRSKTRIFTRGDRHHIEHNGRAYWNRIRPALEMMQIERERVWVHIAAARKAGGPDKALLRQWRFKLRNNAAKRAADWFQVQEAGR